MKKRIMTIICIAALLVTLVPGAATNAANTYRVTAVSAGFNHAVALLGDGSIWSWGYNNNGELGLGHTMEVSRPQRVDMPDNFVAVASGLYHSMALTNDGRLFIWGSNLQGQLGLGTPLIQNELIPQEVGQSSFDGKIVAISAGYYHSLVLTDKGSVYTWGDNSYGGTGLNTAGGNQPSPKKAALPEAVKSISGGYSSSAVIGASGTIYTTGYNGYGELGSNNFVSRNTFQAITLPSPAVQVSNNGYHMIALLDNGDVYTFGKNDMGEAGNGLAAHVSSPYKVTIPLDPGDRVVMVNAGYEHTSVLSERGKLYSWGNKLDGRLGDGSTTGYQRTPLYIRDKVVDITDGGSYRYQIVIIEGSEAWAAGYDQWGKIGNDRDIGISGASTNEKGFVIVEFLSDSFFVKSLAAGFNHAIAIAHDGNVWSWGYNNNGELGLGHTRMATVPMRIMPMTCKNIIAVTVGLYHSAALANDGRLFIWGHNGQGQLGLGLPLNQNVLVPQEVDLSAFDGKVVAVSAGYYHTLALTAMGSVYAWGDHSYGGTGLGTSGGSRTTPQKVTLPEAAKAISGGYSSSAVIGVSGTIYTTGYNGYGELGSNNFVSRNTFQAVTLPNPAVQISNNGYHMIALLDNGDIYTWGKNDLGEVGNGLAAHVSSPYKVTVPLDPGDRIVSVNAGYEHTSVLSEFGKLYCWGSKVDGRLGDGSTTGVQRTPLYIRNSVANITDGGSYRYQLIILRNGEAWAAGYDQWGKMGNDKDLGLTDASSNAKGFVIVEFCRYQ